MAFHHHALLACHQHVLLNDKAVGMRKRTVDVDKWKRADGTRARVPRMSAHCNLRLFAPVIPLGRSELDA